MNEIRPTARSPLRSARARHTGAALIISLVLLLALTVLGISGIGMAALELTMAGNAESQQFAFQAAETGIDLAIAQPATLGSELVIDEAIDADGAYRTRSTTRFVTTTLPPDGAFSTDISAYHFDTVSVGTGPRNAVSTHRQSFYVLGPAAN